MSIFDPNFPLHPQSKPAVGRKAPVVRDYEGIMAELMNPKPKPKPKLVFFGPKPKPKSGRPRSVAMSDRRKQVLDLWNYGFTLLEIVEMLGDPFKDINNDVAQLRKSGQINPKAACKFMIEERRARLFAEHLKGDFTVNGFAEKEGASYGSILSDIKHLRATHSHYAEYRKEREAKAGSDKKT